MPQMKENGSLFVIALIACVLSAPPAAAGFNQSTGWQIERDEYKCTSVSRTQAMQKSTVYMGYGNYGVYFTYEMGAMPGSANSTVKVRGSGHPPHTPSITFAQHGWDSVNNRSSYVGRVVLQGGTSMIDWLSRSSPTFDVYDGEQLLGTVTTDGISQARAILDACRPIVPPANRAVTPKNGYQNWLNPADFWSVARKSRTETIGRISATLSINTHGRVDDCTITMSSGYPLIDTHFCYLLKQKGRFTAATDALTKHVPSSYEYKVSKIVITE